MIKYIKWALRVFIVVVFLFCLVLPCCALLIWVGSDKMTIKRAIQLAYAKVDDNWWALSTNE